MSILDRILKLDPRYAKGAGPKSSVLKLAVPALVVAGGVAASNPGLRDKLFAKNAHPSSSAEVVDRNKFFAAPGSGSSSSSSGTVNRNQVFSGNSSSSSSSSGASGGGAMEDQSGKIDPNAFIPEEGYVVRDNRGNIIYKMCRPLTEGQKTAQAEMNAEKARFDRAVTALSTAATQVEYTSFGGQQNYACGLTGPKAPPAEAPCPTYKNFNERRDFFRQEYYRLTNQLRTVSDPGHYASDYECKNLAGNLLNQIDPNWKTDPGRSTASAGGVQGVQ